MEITCSGGLRWPWARGGSLNLGTPWSPFFTSAAASWSQPSGRHLLHSHFTSAHVTGGRHLMWWRPPVTWPYASSPLLYSSLVARQGGWRGLQDAFGTTAATANLHSRGLGDPLGPLRGCGPGRLTQPPNDNPPLMTYISTHNLSIGMALSLVEKSHVFQALDNYFKQ